MMGNAPVRALPRIIGQCTRTCDPLGRPTPMIGPRTHTSAALDRTGCVAWATRLRVLRMKPA